MADSFEATSEGCRSDSNSIVRANNDIKKLYNENQMNMDDDAHNQDDDDNDDSECWDDAKALLNNDEEFCTVGGTGCSKIDSNTTGNTFHPASSSSAYSSLRTASTTSHKQEAQQASSSTNQDDLILHRAVFNNDEPKVMAILNDTQLIEQGNLVNRRDKHGNTALHLACIMGRSKDMISAFLQKKWSIDTKNHNRWTPFHEACSYGNREIISLMAKQLKDDVDEALHNSKLLNFLEKTRDYRLVLKWEFQSWVPFVSRMLPSDVCVINKQGKYIRIDTRLLDFEGLFRKKGDSCLVYSNNKWIVMNNTQKKYQYFETPTIYKDIEDKVDEFMASDIMDLELKSSDMQLTRSTSGWIWKANKVGKVGRFNVASYDFTNVFLVTRKRREHLSEEDLKRNKLAYRSAVHIFKFGEKPQPQHNRNDGDDSDQRNGQDGKAEEDGDEVDDGDEDEDEVVHRESLPPPPTNVTWQTYNQSEPGEYPNLGRKQNCKVVKKAIKASVAMSEEFPLTKKEFLDLLSIVPIKMFKKLKEFVEMKLPDGFPVRLDIPLFSFLAARITFEDFAFHEGPVNESLFTIPQDYELDPNLLPGRFRNNQNNQSAIYKDGS